MARGVALLSSGLGVLLQAASPDLSGAAIRLQRLARLPLERPALTMHKASHRLELRDGATLVKTYRTALGHRGLRDKVRQGDHLTPEGRFYICTRNERSRFHLFLGLSYPHEAAAARGLRAGLLTPIQHDAILRALKVKACPSWETPLGGAVGIHGGGTGTDWTWGCIALENPDVEELWLACPLGTPVDVLP